jgi:predicted outer membrane repeat protein
MHSKLITIAVSAVAAYAAVALGLGSAQARAAVYAAFVPCLPAALAAGITGAGIGETLSLTPHCTYQLTAALPAVNQDLTIQGNGATIERSFSAGTPDFSILTVNQGDLAVGDLNFRNGGSGGNFASLADGSAGGAIDNNGNLTVSGGNFSSNGAEDGGAILNEFGNLSIRDAVFTGNTAFNGGAIENNGTMVVTDSTFAGNSASRLGGAVATAGDATVTDCTFPADTAADGGGIWSTFTTAVTGSDFRGDKAGFSGGGVFNDDSLTLTGGQVVGNTAASGGGVYNDFFADGTVTGTAFSRNQAAITGGGMDNEDVMAVSGIQMYSNSAGQDGGGIYTDDYLTAADSQILHNTAATGGGGIYNGFSFGFPGSIALSGTAVLDNQPDNCEGCQIDNGVRSPGLGPVRRVRREAVRYWPGGRRMRGFPAGAQG